jgi:predicted porin
VAGKAATPDVRGDTYWAGVAYKPVPKVTLTGAIYHVNVKNVAAGKDADPTMYVARYRYALSKRTDLYTTVALCQGEERPAGRPVARRSGFATTQRGLTAGIQHRF